MSPRRQYRRLGMCEQIIYDACGRDGLMAFWAEHRDRYNAKRRELQADRRRRIAELWEEDPSLGSKRLARLLGVTVRTVWRDRAALRANGIVPNKIRRSPPGHT